MHENEKLNTLYIDIPFEKMREIMIDVGPTAKVMHWTGEDGKHWLNRMLDPNVEIPCFGHFESNHMLGCFVRVYFEDAKDLVFVKMKHSDHVITPLDKEQTKDFMENRRNVFADAMKVITS